MKKILTTASLAALAFAGCAISVSPAFAQEEMTAPALIIDNAGKAKRPAVKKKFRYLDMVQLKHPASIRNAVIVYEHGLGQRRCKVHDGEAVSACLHGPTT